MRIALALLPLLLIAPPALADTTVYVVRHAEKVVQKGVKDPALTPIGKVRAETLAAALRSVPLRAVYTTKYRRNTETAGPSAQQAKLQPIVHDADKTDDLVKRLKTEYDGAHVLVVGHSNTVPEILEKLGAKPLVKIDHGDYDNLFVVHLTKGGATLSHLHFGEMNQH